jgi:hypothetical protein
MISTVIHAQALIHQPVWIVHLVILQLMVFVQKLAVSHIVYLAAMVLVSPVWIATF